MRILHTSDWHIGRTFHGYGTTDAAKYVLGALPELIKKHKIDVVVASGDIFDTGAPAKEYVQVLRELFEMILATGVKLMVSSGNHDSAIRLGFTGAFSAKDGLNLFSDVENVMNPVQLEDEHGPVDFYGIPFIEPTMHTHLEWMPSDAKDQHAVINAAMDQIRKSVKGRESKGRRSVVLSHTFVAGAEKESSDSERAITKDPLVAGGVDSVPVNAFKGVDYTALGHIHSRATLAPTVRYSGALLHYSFKEAGKPRGGWLVDLVPGKETEIEWVDLPIFKNLIELRGTFDEIMQNPDFDKYRDWYVRVVYTDPMRQLDAMRKLQTRFPSCAEVINEPSDQAEKNTSSYRDRIAGKTDLEIIENFLVDVRNGQGATKDEVALLKEILAAVESKETDR
jgi:exonuclease SbcD